MQVKMHQTQVWFVLVAVEAPNRDGVAKVVDGYPGMTVSR
jgi:hypothetical protein